MPTPPQIGADERLAYSSFLNSQQECLGRNCSSAACLINMPFQTSLKFNSGYSIPAIGLGTWVRRDSPWIFPGRTVSDGREQQSKPNEAKNAVETALKLGYRHIDAAACYNNEKEVGDGILASGVDRKDIFVCGTKLADLARR